MTDISNEPTMEDILSSIKKIISEDSTKVLSSPRPRRVAVREDETEIKPVAEAQHAAAADEEDVLELTEMSPDPEPAQAAPVASAPVALVSADAETASRSALEALSALVVKPEVHGTDTLEGLVREMLRPMLREWLDANLPHLVEAMVAKEIARISGKTTL